MKIKSLTFGICFHGSCATSNFEGHCTIVHVNFLPLYAFHMVVSVLPHLMATSTIPAPHDTSTLMFIRRINCCLHACGFKTACEHTTIIATQPHAKHRVKKNSRCLERLIGVSRQLKECDVVQFLYIKVVLYIPNAKENLGTPLQRS